jgi:hypothetical protein
MQTNEQIKKAIEKLGVTIVHNKKSANELYKHLKENETIISVFDAPLSLAVITNERFVRLKTQLLSPTDVKEVYLKDISNIDIDAGFLTTTVFVKSAGGTIEIIVTNKEMANIFKRNLNDAKSKLSEPVTPKVDIISQLEKLAELKEKGILTEAEFLEQKQRLLS